MRVRKWAILLLLALCGLAYVAFDLGRFLRLDFIQQAQDQAAALHARHPVATGAAYFALYVGVTALSFPGAAILTLAGGAVFGLWWGTLLVSFASTLGATLAMQVARHLLRDTVQARFGHRLAEVDRGVARDGAFYLFSLRLIPAVPFFMLNLLAGLTRMRTWTYYWVSQLGMLPATVVYVYAGTELASIDALADVASPGLVGAFVLLGLFPLLARRFVDAIARRKVFARWRGQRPRHFERNLVVIGAGAAGLVSALIGATVRARVTLVESHTMGGDCLNYGCVPSKALIRTARLRHQMAQAARFGLVAATGPVDLRAVMARIQGVIAAIAPHDSVQRYRGMGVDVQLGHARIVNPWTVEVRHDDGSTRSISTRSIVIATGARPVVPALAGLETVEHVTSDTLWERFAGLDALPARLLVLGGGPIGCELAQAFARLGAAVTLLELEPRILVREDPEVSEFARAALVADGVRVLASHQALRCECSPDGQALIAQHQGREVRVGFDCLILALGRAARLDGYGLEELGIATQRTVQTNEYLQTIYPNIYAAGDVAGPFQFTHVAAHQAWHAAVNALFGGFRRFKLDYRVVPWATFIDPEVARVGLNEQQAREQGIACEVVRYDLDDLDRAIADGEAHGFVKVLTAPGSDRILGVTIVGSHAAELLAEFVLAMRHGLGLNRILATIHTYPTWSEASKYAAGAWKRAHTPERLLEWVRRYHDWTRG